MPCVMDKAFSQMVNKYHGFFRSISNTVTLSATVCFGLVLISFGFTLLELQLCDFVSTLFLNAEKVAL